MNWARALRFTKESVDTCPVALMFKTDTEIIVTIVTRLEIKQIQEALTRIDPRVFVYVQTIKEASGGILKAKGHAK
jgi:hypothetical protein